MFVPDCGYTLFVHDMDQPWIVRASEHRTVTLEHGGSFSVWAAEHWPEPCWKVALDPWQLTPPWPR